MRIAYQNPKEALAVAVVVVTLMVGYLWVDPFAKRYQGKTMNQWLDRAIAEGGIRTDVVMAFGEEAVPELLAATDRWRWLWKVTDKVSGSAGEKINQGFRINARTHKVHDWLAVLHSEGRPVLEMLVEAEKPFVIFYVLKFCDVQELDSYVSTKSGLIQEQAVVVRKMCGDRKRLDDISSVKGQR
jgi:hypothetical protein